MSNGIELPDRAMAAIIKPIEKFLNDIVGPPLKEMGGMLGDKVMLWRFKNRVKIIEKAKEFLEKEGIEPKKVPFKILSPILEAAEAEEDEFLQKKWASLLANAANSEYKNEIRTIYISLLKDLTPTEAKFLEILFDEYMKYQSNRKYFLNTSPKAISRRLKIDITYYSIMTDNLIRNNLCEPDPNVPPWKAIITFRTYLLDGTPSRIRGKRIYYLTALGLNFVDSCKFTPNRSSDPNYFAWRKKI